MPFFIFLPCHSPCIASLRSLILGMGRDSETCATLRQLCWWRHHHKCDWCGHLLRSVPQVWCVLGYPPVQWQRATRINIDSCHRANCGAWGCGTWGSEARERRTSLLPVAGTVGALSSEHWTWGWAASRRHCRWSGAGLLALARSWGCWNPWSWDQPLCRWPRWLVWPGWPQCLSWWQRCLGRWSHRRPWSLDDPWPKGSHQRSEDLEPNCMAMKLATNDHSMASISLEHDHDQLRLYNQEEPTLSFWPGHLQQIKFAANQGWCGQTGLFRAHHIHIVELAKALIKAFGGQKLVDNPWPSAFLKFRQHAC